MDSAAWCDRENSRSSEFAHKTELLSEGCEVLQRINESLETRHERLRKLKMELDLATQERDEYHLQLEEIRQNLVRRHSGKAGSQAFDLLKAAVKDTQLYDAVMNIICEVPNESSSDN